MYSLPLPKNKSQYYATIKLSFNELIIFSFPFRSLNTGN